MKIFPGGGGGGGPEPPPPPLPPLVYMLMHMCYVLVHDTVTVPHKFRYPLPPPAHHREIVYKTLCSITEYVDDYKIRNLQSTSIQTHSMKIIMPSKKCD